MPSRKEVQSKFKLSQRLGKTKTIRTEGKSQLTRIGSRNPNTGLFEARQASGTTPGIKTFNTGASSNSLVRATPSGNLIALDSRNRIEQPIIETTETIYPIKILFSEIVDGKILFKIGGDRTTPIQIHEVEAIKLQSGFSIEATITNTGKTISQWIVGIKYLLAEDYSVDQIQYKCITITPEQTIETNDIPIRTGVAVGEYLDVSPNLKYQASGFWSTKLLWVSLARYPEFISQSFVVPGNYQVFGYRWAGSYSIVSGGEFSAYTLDVSHPFLSVSAVGDTSNREAASSNYSWEGNAKSYSLYQGEITEEVFENVANFSGSESPNSGSATGSFGGISIFGAVLTPIYPQFIPVSGAIAILPGVSKPITRQMTYSKSGSESSIVTEDFRFIDSWNPKLTDCLLSGALVYRDKTSTRTIYNNPGSTISNTVNSPQKGLYYVSESIEKLLNIPEVLDPQSLSPQYHNLYNSKMIKTILDNQIVTTPKNFDISIFLIEENEIKEPSTRSVPVLSLNSPSAQIYSANCYL